MIVFVPVKDKRVWARLEQNVLAALNFTPGSEGGQQKLQEKGTRRAPRGTILFGRARIP